MNCYFKNFDGECKQRFYSAQKILRNTPRFSEDKYVTDNDSNAETLSNYFQDNFSPFLGATEIPQNASDFGIRSGRNQKRRNLCDMQRLPRSLTSLLCQKIIS